MQKHGTSFEKLQVLAKSMTFLAFSRNEAIFATFCLKVHANARNCFLLQCSSKYQNMVVCSKGCKFWPNRWVFVLFHEMRHFLQLFSEKFIEMQRHGSLFQKLQSFDQIDDFSCFFTKWGTFCNFFLKSSSKCKDMVLCSKSCKVLAKLMVFPTNYHVLVFRWTFQEKVAKGGSIREKAQKIIDFGKTMQLFRTNYHVLVFRWTFQQKVAKSGSIREKARKIIDLAKTLQLFEQTTMSLHFDQLFRKKLQKVPHFVKNHEKPSIWPKLATFRANYHVLAFSWTFQKEVAKSASFREKAREIIDFANTMQLFEQTTMFLHFDELLRKRLEKVVHFVKKHEKSWIWSKFATFRTNYHVFAFRSTFQEKVAKSASFCKKARKIIDLAKTLQLFEQTTMCLQFDELFRKKLQKVPHFVKKHEKSSIWSKLCNFSNKLPCLCISINFSGKSCKKCLIL